MLGHTISYQASMSMPILFQINLINARLINDLVLNKEFLFKAETEKSINQSYLFFLRDPVPHEPVPGPDPKVSISSHCRHKWAFSCGGASHLRRLERPLLLLCRLSC